MPREWYDHHHANMIEQPEKRALYLSILADKKPYFMRYIYPDLMRRYNTYIKNVNKKALREFNMSMDELLQKSPDALNERQNEFIERYHKYMPVGVSGCVINRICKKVEDRFDGYVTKRAESEPFDYSIMKNGAEYSKQQYSAIERLFKEYNTRFSEYAVFASRERVDTYEVLSRIYMMRDEFRAACYSVCSNEACLCDTLLDLCYTKSGTKRFIWDICGDEVIRTLLANNDYIINIPVLDKDGEIEFGGYRFTLLKKKVEVSDEYCS